MAPRPSMQRSMRFRTGWVRLSYGIEMRTVAIREKTIVTGGSRLIWGCVGILVLTVLLLGLNSSQRSSVNLAGNRSSPPAIGELHRDNARPDGIAAESLHAESA